MSTPEITTPTLFFLIFENGSFPTSRTNFPFTNHLRLPLITTFFFFALTMPCNDTKLMSSFQTLKTAYSNGSTEKEKFSFI